MDVPEDQHDPQSFLTSASSQIHHHKLVEEILSLNGVKFQLLLEIRLYKQTTKGLDNWNELTLRSNMEPLLTADEISKLLERRLQHMLETLEWFTNEGSGWTADMISTPHCTIPTNPRWLLCPTPKEVQNKKSVINVKTKTTAAYDGLCVRHSSPHVTSLIDPANTQQTMDCIGMVFKNQLPSNRLIS